MKRIFISLTAFLLCLSTFGYTDDTQALKMKPPQTADADEMNQLQHIFTALNQAAGTLTVVPTKEDFMHALERLQHVAKAEFTDKPALGMMRGRLMKVLQGAIDLQHDADIPAGEKSALYLLSIEAFIQMLQSVDKAQAPAVGS